MLVKQDVKEHAWENLQNSFVFVESWLSHLKTHPEIKQHQSNEVKENLEKLKNIIAESFAS